MKTSTAALAADKKPTLKLEMTQAEAMVLWGVLDRIAADSPDPELRWLRDRLARLVQTQAGETPQPTPTADADTLAHAQRRAEDIENAYPVPAGLQRRAGVEYGCGKADCDLCYEPAPA